VVPGCGGLVYLGTRVPDLLTKLVRRLGDLPGAFRVEDGFVQGEVDSFQAFLADFQRTFGWNHLEQEGLSVLFLKAGQAYTFKTALETRTLRQWLDLDEARDLGALIEEARVETWFHPIWDVATETLFGWECLLRGVEADGARVPPGVLFSQARKVGMTFPLDRLARLTALQTAHDRGIDEVLFINFIPTAIYDPVFCLRTTVDLAEALGIPNDRIVFEVVETEQVEDDRHLKAIVDFYKDRGFRVALDDVGSGYSSLNLLASLRPDILKVDLAIVRGIDADPVKQSVFRALAGVAAETGARLLAEGVETPEELAYVAGAGAHLVQGFLWGPPRSDPDPRPRYR